MARIIRATGTLAVLALLVLAAPAAGYVAKRPWPPKSGPGMLFVHFGEEHWNDADGLTLLPKVVDESIRFKPDLVTMSGDKADDGTVEELSKWREIMDAYDRAGVPYFAAVGNHDRKKPPGAPGGTVGLFYVSSESDFDPYKEVFASRPYPMGDGPPYKDERIGPRTRPPDDPAGAASHYFVDIGNVRWIFVDNSCWYISACEPYQAPPDEAGLPQFEYLATHARAATADGRHVFVVMHMPTRDPRDQEHSEPLQRNHVMGKGNTPDNDTFEEIARDAGVDAVFTAHMKGQFLYERLGIPYYIDGGAGGELYTTGPVGVDHGYWHGFRLVRVVGQAISTDVIPIFVKDGIRIEGPDTLARGLVGRWLGFGRQPVFNDPAKVERLELRDPDPIPREASGGGFAGAAWRTGRWLLPATLLPLLLLVASAPSGSARRRRLAPAGAGVALVALGGGAVAVAQRDVPTATGRDSLPVPARIWTSANPRVLAPVPSEGDDPRRDRGTQTEDGRFRAVCPGRTTLSVTSGFEESGHAVSVPSRPGGIVRSIARRSGSTLRRRASVRLAAVRLAQHAVLRARIRSGTRTVAVLDHRCARRGAHSVTWRPRSRGRYTLEIAVFSDRAPVRRSYRLRVR